MVKHFLLNNDRLHKNSSSTFYTLYREELNEAILDYYKTSEEAKKFFPKVYIQFNKYLLIKHGYRFNIYTNNFKLIL